ncbi:uncharacterized protein [Phyllobates terribilis]|uniref:uncharacterized protein n=1 Tax=Phyllobates terribilis TaxID=111132 RepID=UPI003CCACFCD
MMGRRWHSPVHSDSLCSQASGSLCLTSERPRLPHKQAAPSEVLRNLHVNPCVSAECRINCQDDTGGIIQYPTTATNLSGIRHKHSLRSYQQGSVDPHLQMALEQLAADDRDGRLQLILKFQERAEQRAQADREERQADREAAERQADRQHQLELAWIQKESSSTQTRESNSASCIKPRPEHFRVMEKDGDLDTFLRGFEKACRQYQLPTDQWARYLTPGLRGKALEVFASLPREQDGDYEAVKQALIKKYQLTPEVYRKKFRALQRGPHGTYSDVVDGLRTNFEQWIQGLSVTTFEDLKDLMVKEQFFHLCPVEVRQFVLDREPKEAAKAAQIVDTYEANCTPEVRKSAAASWKGGKPTTTPSVPASRPSAEPAPSSSIWTAFNSRKCYTCDQTGHISLVCPERQKMNQTPEAPGPTAAILFVGGAGGRARENLQPITVGNTVTVCLKDNGAERTLIRPEFVLPEELIPGKTLTVTGFGGVRRPIPTARVLLDWGAGRGLREVGVLENLPTNVLLGTDLGWLVARYIPDNPPRSDLSWVRRWASPGGYSVSPDRC